MVWVRVSVRVNIRVGVSTRVKVGVRGLGLSAKPGIPGHSGTQFLPKASHCKHVSFTRVVPPPRAPSKHKCYWTRTRTGPRSLSPMIHCVIKQLLFHMRLTQSATNQCETFHLVFSQNCWFLQRCFFGLLSKLFPSSRKPFPPEASGFPAQLLRF